MTNRIQSLRSSVAGARPAGQIPGTIYTNFADRQIGVVNPANAALDLVAVRFHSTTASYVQGDYVVIGGQMYRAPGPIGPGAFNAANWVAIGNALFDQSLNTFDNVRFRSLLLGMVGVPGQMTLVRDDNVPASRVFELSAAAGTGLGLEAGGNSPVVFYVGGTSLGGNPERMRINGNGTVGIATNVNGGWTGNSRFEVNNNGSAFAISAYSTAVTPGAGAIITRVDNTNVSLIDFEYNGTNVGRFVTDGVGLGIAYPNRFSLQAPVTIFNPADSTTALVVAGSAAAVRLGTSGTTAVVEGVDQTGTASYHSLQLGGSEVTIATGGSERMRIDASGNVGIGTVPTQILDVTRNSNGPTVGRVSNADPGGGALAELRVDNGTNIGRFFHLGTGYTPNGIFRPDGTYLVGGGGNGLTLDTSFGVPIYFSIAHVEKMRIDPAGNVGIGKIPVGKLDIAGNQNSETYMQIANADPGSAARATVYVSNGTYSAYLQQFGAGWPVGGTNRANGTLLGGNGPGGLTLNTDAAQPIYFATSGIERMRVDANGRVLINSSGPLANEMLCAVQNAASSYTAFFQNTNTAPGSALILRTQFIGATPNNTGSYFFYGDDLSASRCYFFSNGGLANFSANNANLSDEDVKDYITPYDAKELDGLEQSFTSVIWGKYKYRDQTHDDWNHGPTAQGVERAFAVTAPELVDVAELGPKAADGTPGKNKVVYETDLTHIAHALLARALTEIKELKAAIALLTGGKPASA